MTSRRDLLRSMTLLGALAPAIRASLAPMASLVAGCAVTPATSTLTSASRADYPLTPVPLHEVTLEDRFWKRRLAIQTKTLVPFALEKTQPAVDNLRKTGAFLRGDKSSLPFPSRSVTSDLYKVLEGVSYLLMEQPNPELERRVDEIIEFIASAQKPDGYMYEAHITGVVPPDQRWGIYGMGDRPYSFEVLSHELYNMGHMYEGAVAYYYATKKDTWLRVAEKNAQHINKVFFEGDPNYNDGKPVNQAPGHQEIELALVKLYRATSNPLYLAMAKRFLDIRGVTYIPDGSDALMQPTYAQQHQPVAQQREVVGHAVRAVYMYSAMADVDALTGTDDYDVALDSIWHNIVDARMHITGGLGAIHGYEGFGKNYELPNKESYNETCASVGNVLFNVRMFLRTGDAKFMDVAEVALLNNVLVGTNLEGNRFFYVNPLEADGHTPFNKGVPGRSPWFETACCPTNLARLIPQVPGFMYAHDRDGIYVSFFGSSSTSIELPAGKINLRQDADYPFDGRITVLVQPETAGHEFALRIRIPTWARSQQFVPGELYNYVGTHTTAWDVQLNGQNIHTKLENGFAVIKRAWKAGDQVTVNLPMPVRFNTAIELVEADRGRTAITRGPLVYCAEGVDNGEPLESFRPNPLLPPTAIRTTKISDGVLNGIVKIQVPSLKTSDPGAKRSTLVLVPYYAWNNRGDGSMMVWFPTEQETQRSAS